MQRSLSRVRSMTIQRKYSQLVDSIRVLWEYWFRNAHSDIQPCVNHFAVHTGAVHALAVAKLAYPISNQIFS